MASSHGSSTTLELVVLAAMVCVLLAAPLCSGAEPSPLSGSYEDDKVHEYLRVLDRAAAYRRECFGECAKGCYCSDNPYSCLRDCMPTPPTRRCGATYDVVQGVFSSSATFANGGSGEGFSTGAT